MAYLPKRKKFRRQFPFRRKFLLKFPLHSPSCLTETNHRRNYAFISFGLPRYDTYDALILHVSITCLHNIIVCFRQRERQTDLCSVRNAQTKFSVSLSFFLELLLCGASSCSAILMRFYFFFLLRKQKFQPRVRVYHDDGFAPVRLNCRVLLPLEHGDDNYSS
jgi:hypothetical protein